MSSEYLHTFGQANANERELCVQEHAARSLMSDGAILSRNCCLFSDVRVTSKH